MLLQDEPNNLQALSLQKLIDEKVNRGMMMMKSAYEYI